MSLRDVIGELRADAATRADFEASIPELQEKDQILVQTVLRNIHDWVAPMEADGLLSVTLELFTFDDVDLGMYPTYRLVLMIPRSDLTPIVVAPSVEYTDRSRFVLDIISEGDGPQPKHIIFDRNDDLANWKIAPFRDNDPGEGIALQQASFESLIESLLRNRRQVSAAS